MADAWRRRAGVEIARLDALDRLHERGYISDPKTKAKPVVMSEEGERRARHFGGPVEE